MPPNHILLHVGFESIHLNQAVRASFQLAAGFLQRVRHRFLATAADIKTGEHQRQRRDQIE